MDDFLHNLRSGKLKQTDRANRSYGNQFKGGQKKGTGYPQKRNFESKESTERLGAIKDVLETLAATQLRMAETYEARNRAEQRKARAIEVLVMAIYRKMNPEATDAESLFTPLIADDGDTILEVAANDEESGVQADSALDDEPVEMEVEQSDDTLSAGNGRRELFKLIDTMRSEGTSWVKIAEEVDARGYSTVSGRGIWRGGMIKSFYEKMNAEI